MEITNFALLVPLVIGVTQVIKRVGLSSRHTPLFSLVLGIAGATLIMGVGQDAVVQGLIAGLTACGLWSSVRASASV